MRATRAAISRSMMGSQLCQTIAATGTDRSPVMTMTTMGDGKVRRILPALNSMMECTKRIIPLRGPMRNTGKPLLVAEEHCIHRSGWELRGVSGAGTLFDYSVDGHDSQGVAVVTAGGKASFNCLSSA